MEKEEKNLGKKIAYIAIVVIVIIIAAVMIYANNGNHNNEIQNETNVVSNEDTPQEDLQQAPVTQGPEDETQAGVREETNTNTESVAPSEVEDDVRAGVQ